MYKAGTTKISQMSFTQSAEMFLINTESSYNQGLHIVGVGATLPCRMTRVLCKIDLYCFLSSLSGYARDDRRGFDVYWTRLCVFSGTGNCWGLAGKR